MQGWDPDQAVALPSPHRPVLVSLSAMHGLLIPLQVRRGT